VIARQFDLLKQLDQKAAVLGRTAGAALGLAAGAGFALIGQDGQRVALFPEASAIGLLIGIGALGLAILSASLASLKGDLVVGLGPSSFRLVTRFPWHAEKFLRAAVEAYADALETNAAQIRRMDGFLRLSYVSLTGGLLSALSASVPY
jgi:hypothetical protein